jgi:hypothetical protein
VRYSPAVCMGTKIAVITGKPEVEHVSASFVERQNLNEDGNAPLHPLDQCVQ